MLKLTASEKGDPAPPGEQTASDASTPLKPKVVQASPQPRKEKPRAVRKQRSKRSPPPAVPEVKLAPLPKEAATVVETPPPFEPAQAPEVKEALAAQPVGLEEPDEVEILSPIGFPLVQVRNVRWHPDPRRRTARVRIDRAGPLEVREGEIISGVLIQTIRPGTVVLQLGGRVRSFSIEP